MPKPVIEDGYTLTVHKLVTRGGTWRPVPDEWQCGEYTWRSERTGKVTGQLGFVVELDAAGDGVLTLRFKLGGRDREQRFTLVSRPCRFGGCRWFALCPRTGRAVAKLYSCGFDGFATRWTIGAAYRSQGRVGRAEKLRDRELQLLSRLGSPFSDALDPPKPKWMRWATYSRLALELRAVRYRYGMAMAREMFVKLGIDISEGEVPEITASSARVGESKSICGGDCSKLGQGVNSNLHSHQAQSSECTSDAINKSSLDLSRPEQQRPVELVPR